MSTQHEGWLGVDLDGTLAEYHGWDGGKIGDPIPEMLERLKVVLKRGGRIKIMTARGNNLDSIEQIQDWCEQHGLPRLEVTNAKDFKMVELWDDRAVGVEGNTGRLLSHSNYLKNL